MERDEVTATVKEDGVAMTVGVLPNGQRYVSREGKEGSGTRYFRVSDIPQEPQYNAVYVTAQIWFGLCGKVALRSAWGGDSWNVEVTYPGLNVVECDQAYMTFLYPLFNEFRGELSTDIHTVAFPTTGYIELDRYSVDEQYNLVVETGEIKATMRPVRSAPVPSVESIRAYLSQPHDGGTIQDLLCVNLNHVKKDVRGTIRTQRSYHEHAIKRLLRELTSQIPRDCEGIVLWDGEQHVKLVPQTFVTCNQFEHAVRNMIKRRTFSNDFYVYAPSIDTELVNTIAAMWKDPNRTNSLLIMALQQLRSDYVNAQAHGWLHGVDLNGQQTTTYREHVHLQTMVEFATFIEQLANEPVNTL